jgi:hypothetical protein
MHTRGTFSTARYLASRQKLWLFVRSSGVSPFCLEKTPATQIMNAHASRPWMRNRKTALELSPKAHANLPGIVLGT